MATPMTGRVRDQLADAAEKKGKYSDGATNAMRGLVASRLDAWLTEARRHVFIAAVFGGDGSTLPLTGQELSALLDWMALKQGPMGDSYEETPQSQRVHQIMDQVIAEHELPGMPAVTTVELEL